MSKPRNVYNNPHKYLPFKQVFASWNTQQFPGSGPWKSTSVGKWSSFVEEVTFL